jgi:PAS domain S-box-containing protein
MKASKTISQFDSSTLSEPYELLSALFNEPAVGLVTIDHQLRYRFVNNALAAMIGVAPKKLLGKTIRDVLGKAAIAFESPFKHVFSSGVDMSNIEISAKLPMRDEVGYWIQNYFAIRNAAGKVSRVGAIVVEITEQKRLQQLICRIANILFRNLLLNAHDSDALLQQVTQRSLRQIPGSRANRDRSAVRGLSNQTPVFPHQSVQEALQVYSQSGANATAGALALTPREREVVKLLVEGTGNKETAAILGITVKTVETHRARIMLRLGLHSTRELVQYAIHNKILDLGR